MKVIKRKDILNHNKSPFKWLLFWDEEKSQLIHGLFITEKSMWIIRHQQIIYNQPSHIYIYHKQTPSAVLLLSDKH